MVSSSKNENTIFCILFACLTLQIDSSFTLSFSTRDLVDLVRWHDNSNGIQIEKIKLRCQEPGKFSAEVPFKVTHKAWGVVMLDFYIPGEVLNRKEIEAIQAKRDKLNIQKTQLYQELKKAGQLAKDLKKIDRDIKKLERTHVRMDDLELIFSLVG